MANSVNSTSSSVSPASMKRLTGLVSGLDVDSLVKQMVSAQQAKLNKANQQKQLIDWKRESYLSVISRINAFQSKHLDVLNSNSVLRASAFKSSTAKVPAGMEKYVNVSSAIDTVPGSLKIDSISQLATSQTITSNDKLTKPISMTINQTTLDNAIVSPPATFGGTITVTLDGVTKNIAISDNILDYQKLASDNTPLPEFDVDKLVADLNAKLETAFGKIGTNAKLKFSVDGTNINLEPNPQLAGNIRVSGSGLKSGLVLANNQTNVLDTTKAIGALFPGSSGLVMTSNKVNFSINGVRFEFASTATMRDVMNAINDSKAGVKVTYSSLTDKMVFTATETGTGDKIVFEDLNGTNFLETILGKVGDDFGDKTEGKDAKLKVNGTDIVRSSNTFTIDGVLIELLATTPTDLFSGIEVTGVIDTTKAINNIKEFVESYNELMKFLNEIVREEKKRGYLPLTDEQKAEMSEKQIEDWEKTAKSGLLKSDQTLMKIINELRTAMMSSVNPKTGGNSMSLASIGITTGTLTIDGILQIDEAKLKTALEKDPEVVMRLFTQTSDIPKGQVLNSSYIAQGYKTQQELNKARFNTLGLAQRISEIFTSAVNPSPASVSRGSLIRIAGTGNNVFLDNEANLNTKIRGLDKSIISLQKRLYDAEDKAYIRLAKLEKALASMNSQSSYLFNN